MKQENIFDMPVVSFDIREGTPPKKAWVIVKLVDKVSGAMKIRSAYYEDGVFWDDAGSHSMGLEESSNCNGKKLYDWKIVSWFITGS